eukprot:12305627-Heterocapsa_arctica.AAC.1
MEWIPTDANPADELSRGDASPYASLIVPLEFPRSLLPTEGFMSAFESAPTTGSTVGRTCRA